MMASNSETNRLRSNKGFTLIEMAIVLVIIGIVLGAVMKGQDLITNSKAKGVTSAVNNWKALAYAYADRNGKFPGDPNRTGFIKANAIQQLYSTMSQAPTNPVNAGGQLFYVYFGTDTASTRNVMAICTSATCDQAFSKEDVELIKSIDTSLDGSADPQNGTLIAASAIGGLTPSTPDGFHGDPAKIRGYFTGYTLDNSANWAETSKAAIYYFDKAK